MKNLLPFILSLYVHLNVHSQFIAARNQALGSTFLTHEDILSANSNISKLSSLKAFSTGIAVTNRFALKELQGAEFVVAMPMLKGYVAISLSQYGFNLYRQNQLSIAYALNLSPGFSMGLQINYRKLLIEDGIKDRSSIYPNLAMNYRINAELELSILLTNITLDPRNSLRNDLWPTSYHIALGYDLNSKVRMFIESSLDLEFSIQLRYGIEYYVSDLFVLRSGFMSDPSSFSMGFSFELKKLTIDLASSYQAFLGLSPSIAIRYEAP